MEEEFIKSRNWYRAQMLSMMTGSDILEIISDKINELKLERENLKKETFGFRGDNRKILEMLSEDRQKDIEKIIKFFQYELKMRDPYSQKNQKISIDELKSKITIIDTIEIIAGLQIDNTRRLIPCPFPSHKDNTASFKIYENTDSFHCFGCHKSGDQINFIEHYFQCSPKEAIKKFISLIK